MNFDQLRTFQAVARTGSFTKAGRKLFLTQPAVSQQIQALEASYGVRLFDRSGKRIHLTREGEMLLSKTSKIVACFREIEVLFEEISNLNKGRLDIATSAVFGTYFLPRPIGRFNHEYPCIEIHLNTGNSHDVISMLLAGKVEFGFGGLVENEPELASILIHQEPLVTVVGSRHPLAANQSISLDTLHSVPFIWREQGTQIRKKVEEWLAGAATASAPKRFIELKNVETAKRLVEEGYGVTVIPEAAVERELASGLLTKITLPGLDMKASYYLHYPKKRHFSKAAEVFLALFPVAVSLSHAENMGDLIH
ncbi:MAG: LysR family transcriptional regulator [Deltaproteobacteria bacterium]|nr:LysR family transcriptional regulator [Deltaproteobacteria bacterium]